jgi:hypothetical protein
MHKEKEMDNKRAIDKLSTVLDLFNHNAAGLKGRHAVRIRFDYDGLNKTHEYTVLTMDIPKESAESIIMWLKRNVKSEDIIQGLKSNILDAGNYN